MLCTMVTPLLKILSHLKVNWKPAKPCGHLLEGFPQYFHGEELLIQAASFIYHKTGDHVSFPKISSLKSIYTIWIYLSLYYLTLSLQHIYYWAKAFPEWTLPIFKYSCRYKYPYFFYISSSLNSARKWFLPFLTASFWMLETFWLVKGNAEHMKAKNARDSLCLFCF